MEQIGQLHNNCATKATLQACADGVPYMLIVSDGCCNDSVLSYINLNTGEITSTMPANFTIGECPTEECTKIYKDACANGVPYVVSISENCDDSVAAIEYINLITGGKTTTAPTDLQFWSCEAIPTQSCVAFMETESFTATAGQTTFNISQVASGDVRLSRNGATLHDGAAAVSGTTVTYVPGINNAEPLLAGDRIDISYIYVDCEQVDKGFTDCKGDELEASTALVTCAALNPDDFEIDPATGEVSTVDYTDCIGNALPSGTSLVACAALNPDHFEIDPTTGEVSSKCCDQTPADQITCYEYCTPASTSSTETFVHKEDYNSVQAYSYFKNLTYVASPEGDSQYSIRVVSGRNTPALNLPIISGGNYQLLANPLLIFEATGSGMTPGSPGYVQADVLERASVDKANFIYQVLDASNNQVIASLEPGVENNSWTQRKLSFTVPASGSVKYQILSKRSGSSAGNDPCIDDTKIAYYASTAEVCTTYQKVISNGVTTWYDESGNVVSQPTQTLTLIACPSSGGVNLTDCVGNALVEGDAVVKCDALNPAQFSIDGTTGQVSVIQTASTQIGFSARLPQGTVVTPGETKQVTGYTTVSTTGGGWDASTGVFTAPEAGWYDATASLRYLAADWNAGSQSAVAIWKNGVMQANAGSSAIVSVTNNLISSAVVNTKMYLAAGDTVTATIYQISNTGDKTTSSPTNNTFSVVKVA